MKHQRIARLLALSIPFATALPMVSAAPRGGAPAYGYRRNNPGQFQTFRGVVNAVRSNREFDLRVNGELLRVKSDSFLNLRRGDLVDVRGDVRGQTLYAETVVRRDDNIFDNGGRDRRVDFRGEVLEVESRVSLRVRAENGRVYSVRTVGDLNRGVSNGDFVRVQGQFDGSFVRADNDDVDVVRDGAYPYGSGYGTGNGNGNGYGNTDTGRRVSFPATIRTVDRGEIEVRGDNGSLYQVRVSASIGRYLRAGDRVQVQGITRNQFVQATSIERLR